MIKKWNWTATIFVVINFACLFLIGKYVNGLGQGMAIMGVFIFPLYFLVFTILVGTYTIIKRKVWFTKEIIFSTILMLFFCTPIPIMIVWYLMLPSLVISEEMNNPLMSNISLKTEEDTSKIQIYKNNSLIIQKK